LVIALLPLLVIFLLFSAEIELDSPAQ